MKIFLFIKLLFSSVYFLCVSFNNFSQNVGDEYRIEFNKINLPINNRGLLADVNIQPLGSGGRYEEGIFLYSSGFFLSGFHDDTLWTNGVLTNVFLEDYLPGTTNIGPNDPRSALYKLRKDDPPFGQSWQDWIDAVELGADFYDGDGDGNYNPVDLNNNGIWDPNEDKPDVLGDETIWCSYNDGVPAEERRWDIDPFGIEIKQTIFGFESVELPLSNVVFIRYKVINTGSVVSNLEEVIFSLSYDPDLGEFDDDLGGTDTTMNAHYTYNDSTDFIYGNNPPAFLIDFLSGPVSYIPGITFIDNNGNGIYENGIDTPLDTAYSYRGPLGVHVFVGAKNLEMLAGITYADGDPFQGEPHTPLEARNYMRGLQKDGTIADPCTYPYGEVRGGVDCTEVNPVYWYSGDPSLDYGWINTLATENHSIFSLEPFELSENQTNEIVVAFIIGRGTDALNSVDVSKVLSDEIQEFYENNFGYPIVLHSNKIETVNQYSLSNNFPNPFNPTTKIKYSVGTRSLVSLQVYDVLGNEIATLVNEELPVGEYEVEFDGTLLSSGIYFYRLKTEKFSETKKMLLMK